MKCDLAELELSARLDGARDRRLDIPLEGHLASCPSCRNFMNAAERLRERVRLEPAPEIPDLVEPILRAVETRRDRVEWPRFVAAFAAGAAAAAVALGGLPLPRHVPPALAKGIPGRVAEAAEQITDYTAAFSITERNFHTLVPERRFEARVEYRAPERFEATIDDRTAYPSPGWPRNDIRFTADGRRWAVSGPATCPREGLPACATSDRDQRTVRGREPFDAASPLPTDIVVPVRTLADRAHVMGRGRALDRPAIVVSLPYRDAAPLFAYLYQAGSWRPFFRTDPVLVWLDERTWFPLRYEVSARDDPERVAWAQRSGLATDRANETLLSVEVVSLQLGRASPRKPPDSAPARDGGFRDLPFAEVASHAVVPGRLEGLRPYRSGTFVDRQDEYLLSYARGSSWLKIRQTGSWREQALFGNVGPLAEQVLLPGGGVGYYEPATVTLGRRLSIHAAGHDLYLETTLRRDELLRVAASLPVTGEAVPSEWRTRTWPGGIIREQLDPQRAREVAPYVLLPGHMPPGYRPSAALVTRNAGAESIAIYYRRVNTELDGVGIRLHQTLGADLSPPLDPDVIAVAVRGVTGRYSPEKNELEWFENGAYRSLRGSLTLHELVRVAESLS